MTDEFALIERYFEPLSRQIGDDCAIIEIPPGQRLATSVDTLVEGVHFPAGTPAEHVAFRAVAAALSDLAATGAEARAISLALTLPEVNEAWLAPFAAGLESALQEFGVELTGGDTTRGPLTVTVQVFGSLPADRALSRGGAVVGDALFVSGSTGDAAAALSVLQGDWAGDPQYTDKLLARFYRPRPRLALGQVLLDIASSAIDISDGLLADAAHLCERSGVGIEVDETALPLSRALQSLPDRGQAISRSLSGGDDYELLFTVAADRISRLPPGCTRIGEVIEGAGVTCGHATTAPGYRHFSTPAGKQAAATAPVESGGPLQGASTKPVNAAEAATGETALRSFGSWRQFLAFGFGSGMAPKAPGTAGTVAAIPLYLLMSYMALPMYSLVLLAAALLGIWLCERASAELGVHDHPGIVWDEFVGYWITLWALPPTWYWVLAGFLVFRFFDVLKPWPISLCDRKVHGGLGIMLDDIVAGVFSCGLLHAAFWLVKP